MNQSAIVRKKKAMNCMNILYCTNSTRIVDLSLGGRVDRASATEAVDSGSIPGRVKPKTIKIGIHSFPA